MHKNIFLQHLQAEPGPKVGVSALMLIQMVRPHEGLVTKSTHELLYPRVHSLVARQLVASEIEKKNINSAFLAPTGAQGVKMCVDHPLPNVRA